MRRAPLTVRSEPQKIGQHLADLTELHRTDNHAC